MRVLVAPDSAGGTLDPVQMADAIVAGWRRARPDDDLRTLPLADGGEGLLAAVGASTTTAVEHVVEVAGPRGLAIDATWLELVDRTAVIESAQACGLALLTSEQRDPLATTTWGVGQLIEDARRSGARRILVGLGGSATVDGGTGALSALGVRLTVVDGSGLKIGAEDLPRIHGAARTWVADWAGVELELLADVADPLLDAPVVYGPQKGADTDAIAHLEEGLRAWRAVAESDLGADPTLADAPGAGAAGGLAYGLAAGLGGRIVSGAGAVAELVGLSAALAEADVLVTGEGRVDATSLRGKVVGHVLAAASAAGVTLGVVVGQISGTFHGGGVLVEEASPDGPGEDPAADIAAAAARLAVRVEDSPTAGG